MATSPVRVGYQTRGDELKPPSIPAVCVYTPNWCEENVYFLAKRLLQDGEIRKAWRVYAFFISNRTRTVALWSQKLREDVVVWDYHVILAIAPRLTANGTGLGLAWVYDFDSRLESPCLWKDYVARTFPYSTAEAVEVGWTIPETYRSLLRIVPGEEYLERFASDRSHMLVPGSSPPRYNSPTPAYPCIQGEKAAILGITNNLMSSFVCMDIENTEIGRVYTVEEANALCR